MPPRRRPQLLLASLLLTVVLAVGLGFIIYLSVSSLPYLAVSPTTDPVFGALNACVLEGLKERTGFAPARDASRIAAWSPASLVVCGPTQTTPGRRLALPGITAGAWDGRGGLWLAQQGADADRPRLLLLRDDAEPRDLGELAVQALAGLADGVVVLEPSGHLVALDQAGAVVGTHQLPQGDVRTAVVTTSGDGQRVLVTVGGGIFAFDGALALLRAEAPCEVAATWWQATGHRVLVACAGATPLALAFDVDTGQTEATPARPRAASSLVGPAGVWFQACDVLPCSAEPP
jgi:hypothetical protein